MNHIVALSHPGRRRRKNEDTVLQQELADSGVLLVVADGVGGERAGEVASAEAVQVLRAEYAKSSDEPPALRLQRVVNEANSAVWRKSRESGKYNGMSTTLVAAVVRGSQAWLVNVGDSRGYVIAGGTLRQVTADHSLVAERVREGELTEEEARHSRVRNVITRSVGSEEDVEVDVFGPIELAQGTRILLCSDGLTDVVEDEVIQAVAAKQPVREAAQHLIDLANKGGGPDNISVVMYEASEPFASPPEGKKIAGLEPPGRYAIAGITTVLVAVATGAVANFPMYSAGA